MGNENYTVGQAMGIAVEHFNAGRVEAALELLRRIAGAEPNDPVIFNTLGVVLAAAGYADESYRAIGRSLELNPNFAPAHANMGICQANQGDLAGSIGAFERAVELDPGNPSAHDGLGRSLLANGELQRGWREQEWRWEKADFERRRFAAAPMWKGEDLRGRTIFLYSEQGLGDVIQFCRYAPLLADQGAEVILEVPGELMGLMGTLRGKIRLVPLGMPPPSFDLVCPLMSVPLWYGTTLEMIPAQTPYLWADAADVETWQAFFETDSTFKVGINWAGRPTHRGDSERSIRLAAFGALGSVPGVRFYSVQKGEAAGQIGQPPAGMRIVDLGPRLENFAVSAAVMANLDLVI
jgi:hypothetical protein